MDNPRLFVPICNRTNYSKLKPVLLELRKHNIKSEIIASSSLILEKYGNPYTDIEKDGFKIVKKIDCLLQNDSLEAMTKTAGLSLIEHSSFFQHENPNGLLVVGDRVDMLPPVLAAKFLNIPIFHIQGGEKSGSIDNTIRELITVCSNRHYVATYTAYQHVCGIAGPINTLYTGCPAVEYLQNMDVGQQLDTTTLEKSYKDPISILPGEEYFLIIVHPVTTENDSLDMKIILESLITFNKKMIVIYPNSDAFNGQILHGIRKFRDKIITIKHCPLHDFVKFMAHASCIIGNSSAAIREAASFGVPVINIGKRQNEREKNPNTTDVNCDTKNIQEAIKNNTTTKTHSNKYYKKNSIKRIAEDVSTNIRNNII